MTCEDCGGVGGGLEEVAGSLIWAPCLACGGSGMEPEETMVTLEEWLEGRFDPLEEEEEDVW